MITLINQNFTKDASLGTIRLISGSKINEPNIDKRAKSTFLLIHEISNLSLYIEDSKTNYINNYHPGTEILDFIQKIVDKINNTLLKGYFYDVLQTNKRNKYIAAKQAVTYYYEATENLDSLSKKRSYYIRISQILRGLGKGNVKLIPDTIPEIFDELISADIEKDSYSITKIAREIIPLNPQVINWDKYIYKVKDGLRLFEKSKKFQEYRDCNHILALILKEEQLEYLQNVARSYFWEAIEYDKTPNISQHLIVNLYKQGLKVYESLKINSVEVDERKKQLIEIQEKAVNQLYETGIKINIPTQKIDIQFPTDLNIFQAVHCLINLPIIPKSYRENILELEQESFYHKYFSSSISDSLGNTMDTSVDNEKNIFRIAKMLRDVYCNSIIIPAYEKFSENFSISETEVYHLISYSKFIPTDRIDLYAHALYQGFCGNFAAAVYILIPQIENGIRYVLESNDILVRKLTEEKQKTMSLEHYLDKLQTLLHDDLLFDLRVLLIEEFGDNMRHNIAHGLYPTSQIFSAPGIYLWWIALKLAIDYDRFLIKD